MTTHRMVKYLWILGLLFVIQATSCFLAPITTTTNHKLLNDDKAILASSSSSPPSTTDEFTPTEPYFWKNPESQQQEPSFYLYTPPAANNQTHIEKEAQQLCHPTPSGWWSRHTRRTLRDVTVFWNPATDHPEDVAQQLLLLLDANADLPHLKACLVDSLTQFQDFCQHHHHHHGLLLRVEDEQEEKTTNQRLKARLVATRGPSGTKCPQWHIDHVPVRWIQSFCGPGCEFVREKGVRWNAFVRQPEQDAGDDDDDDDDVEPIHYSMEERNRALVDESIADIYRVPTLEAALLVGNQWKQHNEHSDIVAANRMPVVHKSPSNIPAHQGRVLLTQDIVEVD